ncbi:hypothetical protein [Thioflexithrix psekupsensis]|nr:hypothetical protein [Thioflexithrix psekupsensis]
MDSNVICIALHYRLAACHFFATNLWDKARLAAGFSLILAG